MHGWFGSYATVACGVERGGGISTHAHICFPVMKRHFLESWGGEEKEGGREKHLWVGRQATPILAREKGGEKEVYLSWGNEEANCG